MNPTALYARCRAVVLTLALLASIAVLVSGCGANPTAARLQSRLLSLTDLPPGWTMAARTSSADPKLADTPCLAELAKRPNGWSFRTAGFVEGRSVPNLGEVLATGPRVGQVWARFQRSLAQCRSATLLLGSTKVQATVRRLAFPAIGRTSSAYAWTFTLAGIRVGFDLVLFQTSRCAGQISYAGLGAPPITAVAAFARAAAAKAQSGSTIPVPGTVSIASAPVHIAHTHLGAVAYRAIGSGPPLLLLTGYGGTMEDWDPRFVDALAQRHHVVTLDNSGVGKTADLPAPLTIDSMADQTSALIDTFSLARPDVLGWSMGSMIAQALTVRHPNEVHRLILCASFPGNGTAMRPPRRELDAFESGEPQKVMAAIFPTDQTAAQNTYLAAISSYPPGPPVPAHVLTAQKNAIDAWWNGTDPAGEKMPSIAVPTLVADGTADRLDPVRNSPTLATLIHGARLQLYPAAGHAFLFQDQASFLPLIESFLGS